ncbi:hypothetical protein HETIRDRAFT_150945 [Heterobasidion irregulare TC 32-1]|uniref:2-dehydropantoate 2-reductase n=1 Tax=Heterobasidion irregulare (strain TC 32-1) TaxID=747525 RepID=W4KGA8_HETIT|nr:uncharacterized protein HETIRDRAFT_150945 [Heterobasidion irregulare TC 32-1]ETW84106.1 hypothetical protein HETIRDRAFT_150945 [Heterobasidion irregulare TC 32-1]
MCNGLPQPVDMLQICVVGLGAIGTYYALALEKSGRAQVTAVCRSNLGTLIENGVDVVSDGLGRVAAWKPHRAVPTPEEAADRRYDFVICAFKALPDVNPTPKLIAPLLHSTDCFVLIQNGIGIHADLQAARPDAAIISSCAWIDATTVGGGRSVVQSGPDKLTSGLHPGLVASSEDGQTAEDEGVQSLRLFHELLVAGGAGSEVTDDINAARWQKILWNATFSTLCTVSRSPVADLLCSQLLPVTLPTVKGIMEEVVSVARSTGVTASKLPENKVDQVIADCLEQYSDERRTSPSRFKPSMLVDLEAGRPMEVEPIVGSVVKIARKHAVATPRLDMIYAQLMILQRAVLRARHVVS